MKKCGIYGLKKYGFGGFNKIILEECSPTDEVLTEREDYWIKYYDSIKKGYNLREAGPRGKFSLESRKKMSVAQTGHKHSIETRNKMKGRKSSYENISKANQSNLGRIYTSEHRMNISNGKLKSKKKLTNEERERIKVGIHKAFVEGRYKKNKIPKIEIENIKYLYLSGTMNKRQLSIKYGVTAGSMSKFIKKNVI